jgi:hypothetical protein
MTPQNAMNVIEALATLTIVLIAGIALLDLTQPRELISLQLRDEPRETHTPPVDYRDAA